MRPASSPSTRACSSTSSRPGSATADAFPDPRGIRLPSLLRRARPRWRARRVGARLLAARPRGARGVSHRRSGAARGREPARRAALRARAGDGALHRPRGVRRARDRLRRTGERRGPRRARERVGRELVVTPIDLPLRGLSAPVRLVHVSDLHLGPLADRAALREALDRVAALAPDLVCVTGDLVDSPATDLDAWMPELARLTARHGVFAVLGNHDRRAGGDRVAAALARWSGWRLLRDEVATVEVAGARLHLVGLEERPEGQAADALPDLVARVPGGAPFVVLAHRPSVLPVAAAVGVPLLLAGHTHGGQLAVPGVPQLNVARLLQMGFEAGCYTRDGTLLHVNRGLGTSGQRVRVGVPREISVLTLTAACRRGRARSRGAACRRRSHIFASSI